MPSHHLGAWAMSVLPDRLDSGSAEGYTEGLTMSVVFLQYCCSMVSALLCPERSVHRIGGLSTSETVARPAEIFVWQESILQLPVV
jgi:hypothetical protein